PVGQDQGTTAPRASGEPTGPQDSHGGGPIAKSGDEPVVTRDDDAGSTQVIATGHTTTPVDSHDGPASAISPTARLENLTGQPNSESRGLPNRTDVEGQGQTNDSRPSTPVVAGRQQTSAAEAGPSHATTDAATVAVAVDSPSASTGSAQIAALANGRGVVLSGPV